MEMLNPLDWNGGSFLLFYSACAGGALLWLLIWKLRLGPNGRGVESGGLGVLELAYLAGGGGRAADTALVGLLEAGAAQADRHRRVMHLDPAVPVPAEFTPFRHAIAIADGRSAFKAKFQPRWQRMHADLAARGLVPGDSDFKAYRSRAAAVLAVPLALGISKVWLGLSRDRPVLILLMLLALTIVLGTMLLVRRPHCSPAGSARLESARLHHARAARAPLPEEMALAFALSGAVVLEGRDYRWAVEPGISIDGGASGDIGPSDGGGGGDGGCGGCSA